MCEYKIQNRLKNQAIIRIPINQIKALTDNPNVISVEGSQQLKVPRYYSENSTDFQPKSSTEHTLTRKNDVIIGIIDVGGFDFTHEDFLDKDGKTRFLSIWDQGSDFREPPKEFSYGAEFKEEHLNQALKANVGVHPRFLERQSQMVLGSHGTHVASIAGGNHGICPHAKLMGVTISLRQDDYDRRKSFYDSSRLADAVSYLLKKADEFELPISINISLGTNGHAHDGSSAINRWIDSELTVPGRCITVAAGNSGQEDKLHENDYGFISGRVHTSGKIEHRGLSKDIFWQVTGNGIVDISENELEIWYGSQDRFSVNVKPPGGAVDWSRTPQ